MNQKSNNPSHHSHRQFDTLLSVIRAQMKETITQGVTPVDSCIIASPSSLHRNPSESASPHQDTHHTSPTVQNSAGETTDDVRVYTPREEPIRYTYASYHRDDIPELNLPINPITKDVRDPISNITHTPPSDNFRSWTLNVPIPTPPDPPNGPPTLVSLVYDIRYTSFGAGNVFVQTDIVISNGVEFVGNIVTDSTKLNLYSLCKDGGDTKHGQGYTPPVLNEDMGTCLSSRPSFRGPDTSGWCDYIDHHEIYPDVRIGGSHDNVADVVHHDLGPLYLFFHVYQSSPAVTLRGIKVDVTATWSDGTDLWKGSSEGNVKGVDVVSRTEMDKLIIRQKKVESTLKGLEEGMRKMILEAETKGKRLEEWEKRLLAIEKRIEPEEVTSDGSSGQASRSVATQMRPEMLNLDVERVSSEEAGRQEQAVMAKDGRRVSDKREGRTFREETQQDGRKGAKSTATVELWIREQAEMETKEQPEAEQQEQYSHKMGERTGSEETSTEEAEKRLSEEIKQRGQKEAETWATGEIISGVNLGENKNPMNDRKEKRRPKEEDRRPVKGRKAAKRKAKDEEEQRRAARLPRSWAKAPQVAGGAFAEHIRGMAESLGRACSDGYEWNKETSGYGCGNPAPDHGDHYVYWSEL